MTLPTPSRSSLLMAPALAWLTALMVVPCALVLALAFFRRGIYGGIEYTFTLENFGLVFDPLYAGIFLNSARIAGTATLIAVVIGYAAAYAIAAAPRRWQPVFLFFAVLPFWSNYLIRTYAWIVLLNREGLITQLLRWLGYTGEPPSMLYSEGAVIAGLVYNYLPFVILACYAPLSRLNPELAEASRDLGASAMTTFRRVILPLTVPGIAAGAVFVFVLSIGNFVTPALLGGVGQLAEGVGQLDAAAIELEALGDPRVIRARPGERCLRNRIAVENGGAPLPQRRLDLFHHHPAEQIGPIVVGRRA
ncbi:MAG: ABC transporter permease [Mesorhizobium sp.]|nr:MAG: ABC transporter permease [Mesorhizobium sp.]